MRILLLDPQNADFGRLQDISCTVGDATIVTPEEVRPSSADCSKVDIIIGAGDFTNGSRLTDMLLGWRTHPDTCMIPCWILSDVNAFEERCLWPRLTVDCFKPKVEAHSLRDWLAEVAEWLQDRMHIGTTNDFAHHSTLELSTSLALRRASGKLTFFDKDGNEGSLLLNEGCLVDATMKHLQGIEAFFEFFSLSVGSYHWELQESSNGTGGEPQPLNGLIADGLKLIQEANLIYHFVPTLQQPLKRTESESALDDGAVPFYQSLKQIYSLFEGNLSAAQILEASPLSRPRTMSCLSKWFSLGDIEAPHDVPLQEETGERQRLLIVDDSKFMCKALHNVFSQDPRFEVVGMAHDGYEALKLIEEQKPDVVTLDMQMPRMDGLTALKHIMIKDPRPVVVLSAFTKETSRLTYESFKYGAVDVLSKPSHGSIEQMEHEAAEIRNRTLEASCVSLEAAQYIRRSKSKGNGGKQTAHPEGNPVTLLEANRCLALVACGAGGFPSFLKFLLSISNPQSVPPIVACMGMPKRVVEALVPNLKEDCVIGIEEGCSGEPVAPGVCYLYSYDCHHQLSTVENGFALTEGESPQGERGPFDHLLCSAANAAADRAIAFFISGIGHDGLEGMRHVQLKGGQTYALSPGACLKPDLPREILQQGFALEVRTAAQLANLLEGFSQAFLHREISQTQVSPYAAMSL